MPALSVPDYKIHCRYRLQTGFPYAYEQRHKGKWRGRTRTNKLVFFGMDDTDWTGRLVRVRIDRTGPWSMQGALEDR